MTDLSRFLEAQEDCFERVAEELRQGRKQSHWMWYIFPQIAGLGHSETAKFYAIHSLAEAEAYLAHTVLGKRLRQVTKLVLEHQYKSLSQIFGHPDDMKFISSMTLFDVVSGKDIFATALQVFSAGKRDDKTITLLR